MSDSQDITDEEIVKRVIDGRTDEFRRLVLRHQDRVFSLMLRQTGDREVARELAQDVFVRAFKGLRSFELRSSFQTWLTRIALNVGNSFFVSRRYRESKRNVPFETETHEEMSGATDWNEPDPKQLEHLRTALGRLKPEFREPLVLCRMEKKTYAEAAALLGIPAGTVCSRINSAVNQLRKQLRRAE